MTAGGILQDSIAEALGELASELAELAAGVEPRAAMLERAAERLAYNPALDGLAVDIEAMVDEALAAQASREAGWVGETDNDRLSRAFARLGGEGVFAVEDFTCCAACGRAEAESELAEAARAGRPLLGYLFYPRQEIEAAISGRGLSLCYGAAGGEDAGAVAQKATLVLAAEGFAPKRGDGARLHVPLLWRRRRFRPR
jgi:hypothetical protein